MYRVIPQLRKVLITTDEVIAFCLQGHTVDPKMIEPSIIVAEERLIRPALGFDCYEALVAQKCKVVTDVNKATLQSEINDSLPDEAQDVVLEVGSIVNALEYLSADNQKLWKEHLGKLVAECVMLHASRKGFVQFSSEGSIHKQGQAGPMNGAGIVTPDLRSVKWDIDKSMMDTIDPLRESMHQWICKQKKADSSKYPDYEKACDCDSDGIAYKRKTNIILGIYDDEDKNDCSCLDH